MYFFVVVALWRQQRKGSSPALYSVVVGQVFIAVIKLTELL